MELYSNRNINKKTLMKEDYIPLPQNDENVLMYIVVNNIPDIKVKTSSLAIYLGVKSIDNT